jgi:hypothetical protein
MTAALINPMTAMMYFLFIKPIKFPSTAMKRIRRGGCFAGRCRAAALLFGTVVFGRSKIAGGAHDISRRSIGFALALSPQLATSFYSLTINKRSALC